LKSFVDADRPHKLFAYGIGGEKRGLEGFPQRAILNPEGQDVVILSEVMSTKKEYFARFLHVLLPVFPAGKDGHRTVVNSRAIHLDTSASLRDATRTR
jgi:hypothetical protein